jgi:hypothetical protein
MPRSKAEREILQKKLKDTKQRHREETSVLLPTSSLIDDPHLLGCLKNERKLQELIEYLEPFLARIARIEEELGISPPSKKESTS